jgi:hypothetical protein
LVLGGEVLVGGEMYAWMGWMRKRVRGVGRVGRMGVLRATATVFKGFDVRGIP